MSVSHFIRESSYWNELLLSNFNVCNDYAGRTVIVGLSGGGNFLAPFCPATKSAIGLSLHI